MKIRKQDYHLTLEDLTMYPAWEYALDEEEEAGKDERTVRPYPKAPPLDPQEAYFIVRASFILSNGSMEKGYITPRSAESEAFEHVIPYDLGAVILTDRGRVYFGYGNKKPGADTISRNYEILGQPKESVFPIHFKADVEIVGIAEGTIKGFLYFESQKKSFYFTDADQKYVR